MGGTVVSGGVVVVGGGAVVAGTVVVGGVVAGGASLVFSRNSAISNNVQKITAKTQIKIFIGVSLQGGFFFILS